MDGKRRVFAAPIRSPARPTSSVAVRTPRLSLRARATASSSVSRGSLPGSTRIPGDTGPVGVGVCVTWIVTVGLTAPSGGAEIDMPFPGSSALAPDAGISANRSAAVRIHVLMCILLVCLGTEAGSYPRLHHWPRLLNRDLGGRRRPRLSPLVLQAQED